MMPPQANFYATADLVRQLRAALKDYSAEAGDSLIAMGDPSIIAVACGIIARDHGSVRILKWDRNIGRYIPSTVNF